MVILDSGRGEWATAGIEFETFESVAIPRDSKMVWWADVLINVWEKDSKLLHIASQSKRAAGCKVA